MREFLGKFRGRVENNQPDNQGRIEVSVPDVLGDGNQAWAMPSVPYAGPGVGFFAIPPQRANVWVEFEGGDPDFPIWTGCFWSGEGDDRPPQPGTAEAKVLKTQIGTITLDDTSGSGGITIETKHNGTTMKIVMNSEGIEITTGQGKIKLTGNQVSINDGALEVT